MAQMTEGQQMEAARSVAAKLEAFHDGLTPDEQRVLDAALRSIAAGGEETTEDATGYFSPVWLPLIVVKIVEMVEQQAGSTQQPSQQPAQGAQRQ
jgi:hypothetical protein